MSSSDREIVTTWFGELMESVRVGTPPTVVVANVDRDGADELPGFRTCTCTCTAVDERGNTTLNCAPTTARGPSLTVD
jgi:hypothetical protein